MSIERPLAMPVSPPNEERGPQTPEDRILGAYMKKATEMGIDTSPKAEALLGETLLVDEATYSFNPVNEEGAMVDVKRTKTIGKNTDKDIAPGRIKLVGKYAVEGSEYVGSIRGEKIAFVNHKGEMRLIGTPDLKKRDEYDRRLGEMGYTKLQARSAGEEAQPGDARFPFPLFEGNASFEDSSLDDRWSKMVGGPFSKPSYRYSSKGIPK